MPLRILHLIDSFGYGALDNQLLHLLHGLPGESFGQQVLVFGDDPRVRRDALLAGILIRTIRKRWPLGVVSRFTFNTLIVEANPHVIHQWRRGPHGVSHRVLRNVRAAAVASFRPHRTYPADEISNFDYRGILVDHAAVCDRLFGRIRLKNEGRPLVETAPLGVEEPAAERSRKSLTDELGLPRDALLIGTVGPLRQDKRIKELIWAADLLKRIRDDAHLLIVGEGPHRWRLERFRDQCEIRDRVHFLGAHRDPASLLPHLDLFWWAGDYPGISLAVIEAMAAGLPVVASDTPGNRDLITPGRSGYLVPVGDRAGYARWSTVLLDDRRLAARCGEAAKEIALKRFHLERMLRWFARFYERIAERKAE